MHRYVIFCPKALFLRDPSDVTAPDLDCLALALDMGLATLETTESAQETQRETLRGLLTLLSTLFKVVSTPENSPFFPLSYPMPVSCDES